MKENKSGNRGYQSTILLYAACFWLAWMTGAIHAEAQSKTSGYLIGQTGWETGSGSNGFFGELAGGIRHNRWGWGLASGIDNAGVTSVPLLADVRWALIPTRHTLEIFSQEGLNMVTKKAPVSGSFTNGPYWYGGLSYRLLPTKRNGGLLISAGVSYKQYKESYPDYPTNTPNPGGPAIAEPEPWPGFSVPFSVLHKDWRGVLTIGWCW